MGSYNGRCQDDFSGMYPMELFHDSRCGFPVEIVEVKVSNLGIYCLTFGIADARRVPYGNLWQRRAETIR